ncbi:hypothetical protein [Streptomyces sp. NPDC056105]|uniref:hypothetical protein n=1 Tax=Streptomyces sp. NPDC056105 TaxID=3345714 RepID=UPI0035E38A37
MKDDEVRARFDGRGRVELIPGLSTAAKPARIEEIAHALGYQRFSIENLGRAGVRLVHARDDGPQARRRAEPTIARLREGGPLLPADRAAPAPATVCAAAGPLTGPAPAAQPPSLGAPAAPTAVSAATVPTTGPTACVLQHPYLVRAWPLSRCSAWKSPAVPSGCR